ncbi:cysteine--tRNA ligase [Patescibacteria group bacterium]|nr:MAG: cysteine--tRNA ligase [Patescibacteria group bacterium]
MLQLFNTLIRKTEEFVPLKKGRAGLYTCGPTVYNYAHIGNLRAYVFEDVLKRVLLYDKYKVKHVMNITDVGHLTDDGDAGEDKMEKGARREGKTAWEIAKFYENAFKNDLKNLNILPADKYPRATEHIKNQIALIKKLEAKGFTYRTSDGVYFDTSKLSDYGKLALLGKQELMAGARVEMGEKKHATDFALWKLSASQGGHPELVSGSPKRQMEWPSPWGIGFPGWHIECSAMSVKYLGQPFDIHCGGVDHIPVHHTNEIAQSEAAGGKPLANYWLHGEFLITGTEKMAKSENNFLTLAKLKEKGISPLAYRYFLLQTHYRKQLNFSWEALSAAQKGLEHLYDLIPVSNSHPELVSGSPLAQRFQEAINNDLDTPAALALVWDALRAKTISKKQLLDFDKVLGLGLNKVKKEKIKIPAEVQKLIKERETARTAKNWAESDRLRREIEAAGFTVEDTPDGQKVRK